VPLELAQDLDQLGVRRWNPNGHVAEIQRVAGAADNILTLRVHHEVA